MEKRGNPNARPVLIVQHAESEHPASLCRAMESRGIASVRIHPYLGESYPQVSEIAGILSLGGPMGANDEGDHPWILEECELLRQSVNEGLPTVGICLGAQMLARALGGRVERNPRPEVGWFPVELTHEGKADPVAGAAGPNPTVYHWHADTFHLPDGALLLGHSRACERQAFRIGERVYGFQFHPEADESLVREWLAHEGVPEDIEQIMASSRAPASVQDADTQLRHAPAVELASLKIAAAIGSVFGEKKSKSRESKTLPKNLSEWRSLQREIILELKPGNGFLSMKGTVRSVFSIAAGEFVLFADSQTGLLWPISIADIEKIRFTNPRGSERKSKSRRPPKRSAK